jgi:hypothetical protein
MTMMGHSYARVATRDGVVVWRNTELPRFLCIPGQVKGRVACFCWVTMYSDDRVRVMLPRGLVSELSSCALFLEMGKDCSSLDVITELVKQCLRSPESAEPVVKRVRGSKTGAEPVCKQGACLEHNELPRNQSKFGTQMPPLQQPA